LCHMSDWSYRGTRRGTGLGSAHGVFLSVLYISISASLRKEL
jgi:hypothetical protein